MSLHRCYQHPRKPELTLLLRGPGAGAHVRVPPGQRPDLQAPVEVRRGASRLLPAADAGKQQVQQVGLHPAGLALPVQVGAIFTAGSPAPKEGGGDVQGKRSRGCAFGDLHWTSRSSSFLNI